MSTDRPVSTNSHELPPALRAAISATSTRDYDGHTEFHRLSPRERLHWMESAVRLIEDTRRRQAKNVSR